MLRSLVRSLAAVAIATLCAGSTFAAEPLKEINISYVESPFNLQTIVMRKQELLEKEFAADGVKINWHNITSGAQQAQAMAAGSLDIGGVMNTTSVLLANAGGNPVLIAAGVSRPAETFAILGKVDGPKTIEDLKGKQVVGPRGTVLHQLLAAALASKGMSLDDVEFIGMDLPKSQAALVAGQTDAALLAASLKIKAEAAGATVIATADGLVNPVLVMGVSKAFADAHPDAVARVQRVNTEATAWVLAHLDEAHRDRRQGAGHPARGRQEAGRLGQLHRHADRQGYRQHQGRHDVPHRQRHDEGHRRRRSADAAGRPGEQRKVRTFLEVRERDGAFAIRHDDLLAYAGPSQLIACTLTFLLFERAFADLSPGAPPRRDDIRLRTAFPGDGVHAAMEMVARAVTDGRLVVDTRLGPPEAPAAPAGRFYFEVAIGNAARAYWPKPGVFDDRFIDMVVNYQDGSGGPKAQADYLAYKHDLIGRLRSMAIGDLFESREIPAWTVPPPPAPIEGDPPWHAAARLFRRLRRLSRAHQHRRSGARLPAAAARLCQAQPRHGAGPRRHQRLHRLPRPRPQGCAGACYPRGDARRLQGRPCRRRAGTGRRHRPHVLRG